jgi:glucose-6-phosphate isomerase
MTQSRPLARDYLDSCVLEIDGITYDFGKQRVNKEDFEELMKLGRDRGIIEAFNNMRAGAVVNTSENRQALHTSLRDPSPNAPHAAEVKEVLEKMYQFASKVRNWKWLGSAGDRITDVINIGIGGSDMGPRVVYEALRSPDPEIKVHFLSSADGILFDRIVAGLDPFKTLVVVSSKSFKTQETMANAEEILKWFQQAGISGDKLAHHMVVVSANPKAHEKFGLPEENLFRIWDWVGGRFSVWSAIGLPVVISLGPDVFQELLNGAHEVDEHTSKSALDNNIPALMALFSYWNTNKLGMTSSCFLPYDERLRGIVLWLQQLEMESLGKTTRRDGKPVEGKTCVAVWGGHGSESQHSFYQWIREGSYNSALDLCWSAASGHNHSALQKVIKANANAQAEALVNRGENSKYFNAISVLGLSEVNPNTLGKLLALYENKTVMLGEIFGINPFDQPGVELGKNLANIMIL